MISDIEIARRLHELADSAGPWDDPMPEIRRRAADAVLEPGNVLTLPGRLASVDDSADAADDADADDASSWDAKVIRPDLRRIGWKVPAAAAAVVLGISGIVGLAKLIPQSDSAKSSSTSADAYSAAGDAGGARAAGTQSQRPSAASASSAAASTPSSAAASSTASGRLSCGPSVHDAAVTLAAPAQVRAGGRAATVVSVGASLRLSGADLQVYVVGTGSDVVIGALRGTTATVTGSPSYPLSGTLRRWSCADGDAPSRLSAAARALPAGSYRLVAVLLPADGTMPVVSAPVPVRIRSAGR